MNTEYSYDTVPYPSYAYPQTHPDHLATLAILSGLKPPPVEQSRVLELGCGAGGNLVSIAYSLPEAEFTGIDLSARAIAEGQRLVAELGLNNISLARQDILDIEIGPNRFDYIIVYGIYSWVSAEVRHKILDICRTGLAPNGVAYISYNAYPGWRLHSIIRDLMMYHTRRIADPARRAEQARIILKFLVETIPTDYQLYAHLLRSMQDFLADTTDGYLLHDFMEDINEPLYFHQFVAQAEQHGLQYLANAEFATPGNLPEDVTGVLFELGENLIEVEQYKDFLTNRAFRETVVCHQEQPLSQKLQTDCLADLRVASHIRPEAAEVSLSSAEPVEFVALDGTALETGHPLTKAALIYLAEQWPRAIPYERLIREAAQLLEQAPPAAADTERLGLDLLTAYSYSMGLIEFHTFSPPFVTRISDRPVVSPIVRYQARRNIPITNLYHRRIAVAELPRLLLEQLDGSRDRAALLDMLEDLVAANRLELIQPEQPAPSLRQLLTAELETQLHQMSRAALLVG